MVTDVSVDRVVSCLKRFGAESIKREDGVAGIDVDPAAGVLVNDSERFPHAFVLACIADRQTQADIAWGLPHLVREAAGGFDIDTLLGLEKDRWTSVLASSGRYARKGPYVGSRRTVVKRGELKPNALRGMLKQLGIRRAPVR